MNIVIITIFNEMNYGAYLQAFALGEYLKSKGHTVSYYENSRWTSRDSFHALHLRDLKHLGFNLSLLRAYKKDWMRITKTNTFDGFDLAIIGSDELWNVRNVNFSHDRYLLGEGVDSRRTITYAVSSNNCTPEEFSNEYAEVKGFGSLDAISVRDAATDGLVRALTGVEPEVVLDPTFLIDYPVSNRVVSGQYMLVYGYYFTEMEVERIKEYRLKYPDAKLVSVGFRHEWCDENVPCGPLDFLDCVRHACAVATSTFHGTVFSIIFRKSFIAFARDNSKILDILDKFGLSDRNSSDRVVASISRNVNYSDSVEREISSWVRKSKDYLENQLSER